MSETINNLRAFGEMINTGEPREVMYDLGEGPEKTELIITYIDGDKKVSERITSPPLVRLYSTADKTSMDITDLDSNPINDSYINLRPQKATFEDPDHPPHELGDLTVELEGDNVLGITQFQRSAR
jgi:hypothetical protein